MPDRTTVVPTMRYADANAAIAWLGKALGFAEHAVYRHPEKGYVMHAELLYRRKDGGVGMIMLGSTQGESEMATHYVQPAQAGGVTTGVYLIVDDCDPVYAAAQSAGAQVVQELQTMNYGGKAFAVRDPEGHIWSVGEYDPFALTKG